MTTSGPLLVNATRISSTDQGAGERDPNQAMSANGVARTTALAGELVPFGSSFVATVKGAFAVVREGLGSPVEARSFLGADVHGGDPRKTAVRYESDCVPFKPRADILCVGNAYPNGGKQGTSCVVAFGVGNRLKQILAIGNRSWKAGIGGLMNTPTPPEPFTTMPVSFENAYGGRDPADSTGLRVFGQNPIGKGYTTSDKSLAGLPLPNLEDPANPIRSWKDQPAPRSFGPVGRTWQPRLARAGTYDKRWLEPGAPALPDDFDERYYNCAPEDQQIEGYLRGDEKVRVVNMHPTNAELTFQLPKVRVRCLADREREGRRQLEDVPTHLDTLWVDMEAMLVVLVWRARLVASAAEGVTHLVVISEPLGAAPSPPETYRHHVDEFEAAEIESEFEEPEIEPVEVVEEIPEA